MTFSDDALDDPAALATVDSALRALALQGAQVRRARLAVAEVLDGLHRGDRPRAVVLLGESAGLVQAAWEPVCPVPLVARRQALPAWTGPLDLVVALVDDELVAEQVMALAEARRRGAELLVAAPSASPLADLVDRAGVLLPAGTSDQTALSVVVLEALHRLGLAPAVDAEEVVDALTTIAVECGTGRTTAMNPAKEVAVGLAEDLPLVWTGSAGCGWAAEQIADALRRASGRPALAGDHVRLLPLLRDAPVRDLFADPFDSPEVDRRPALVLLDDGASTAVDDHDRRLLLDAAERSAVRIVPVNARSGPPVARAASLVAIGRFAAVYLGLALGRSPDTGV